MEDTSLKTKLLHNIEDIELAVRQLAETVAVHKENRNSDSEIGVKELVEIVKAKESELQDNLKLASEQLERQALIDQLEEELQRRDAYVEKLQSCLKEAETVLISAVFQANQKLKSINQANHRKVDPEELIKFAHKISKTNAVAAPLSWQPGDPERPFPTDVEMRKGWLGRPNQPPPPQPQSSTSQQQGSMFPPVQPSSSSASVSHAQLPSTPGGGRSSFVHPSMSQRQPVPAHQFQGMQMHQQQIGPRQTSPYGMHQQGVTLHPSAGVHVPGNPPGFVNPPRFPTTNVGSPAAAQGTMIPPPPPYGSGWRGSQRHGMPQGAVGPGSYGPHSPRSMRQTVPFVPQGRHSSPSMQPPTGIPSSPRIMSAMMGGLTGFPGPMPQQQVTAMAAAQMRHRRPSGSPRMSTPPIGVAGSLKRSGSQPKVSDVETMSSDSSSSSSSDSPT